jgi:hypothetical protein
VNISEYVAKRAAAAAEIVTLDGAIEKLTRVAKSTSGAVAELAALHQDHRVRVEAWSLAGGDGAIPALDRKLVARLEQERDNHEDSRASADAGIKSLVEKRSKAKLDHKRFDRDVNVAVLLAVLREDLPRLADEARDAAQAAADRVQEYEGFRSSLFAHGELLEAPEIAQAIQQLGIMFEPPKANGNLDALNAKIDSLRKGAA